MELVKPVKRVADEEVFYFAAAVVENVSAPVTVFTLFRVGVLVKSGAVKAAERERVFRKVGGDPVKDNADIAVV